MHFWNDSPNVALVYDWLLCGGGGERTLEAVHELFPAPIYTLLKEKRWVARSPFSEARISTSFVQTLPLAYSHYRYYLPLFPMAIEQFDLSAHDVIISLSHCVAKGAVVHPHQLHICYCFTPMRYIWGLSNLYLREMNPITRTIAKWQFRRLRRWDTESLGRVDHFVAISSAVAERIHKFYGKRAEVIYPPVDVKNIALREKKESFYLTVSRMVPYKKIDLIVEAFSHMKDKKLVVIGDGPEMPRIKRLAGKNVELLGSVPDNIVRDLLQRARGFIFAAEEDFGIVVVEAQAAGTPVIAFAKGGALETVLDGQTGIFFEKQTIDCLISAIGRFERLSFDPLLLRNHAHAFSKERFQEQFRSFVAEKNQSFLYGFTAGKGHE